MAGYLASGAPTSRPEWQLHHRRYLDAEVVYRATSGAPAARAVLNDREVPAPFRSIPADDPFAGTVGRLGLLRVEEVRRIAEANLLDTPELARELGALSPPGSRSRDDGLWLLGLLDELARQAPTRPVFAGFVADAQDILTAPLPRTSQVEALRDRFGLAYLDPTLRGGPVDVAIFIYAVEDVPRAPVDEYTAALRAPSVLDGDEYEAFFPAVLPGGWGNAVSLRDDGLPPVREILHPSFRYRPEHLLFSATIRSSPSESLGDSRARHIHWLRRIGGSADLAHDTDGDLGLGIS